MRKKLNRVRYHNRYPKRDRDYFPCFGSVVRQFNYGILTRSINDFVLNPDCRETKFGTCSVFCRSCSTTVSEMETVVGVHVVFMSFEMTLLRRQLMIPKAKNEFPVFYCYVGIL